VDACTIIAKNYVAYARVLARSFAEHHPDGRFSVLMIDNVTGYLDPAEEPFELITPDQIGCEEFELMAARYDVLELSTAVKPWLLRYLLARDEGPVTYLDPDILVADSLGRLDQLGREHGLVLIPHNTAPIPFDGERPSQVDIMIAGVFNLGYVTLAPSPGIDHLLDWWSERLRRDCLVDPVYGYFVDQRWMDLVPGLMSDYAVVRDPEFNVAYWNLHARDLEHDEQRYTVDGRPLAFFHFSGFDPDVPDQLSRHQTRIKLHERPVLARICHEYAAALNAAGHATARVWPYGYGALPGGVPFGPVLRTLFREGEERGELHSSPLEDQGARAFLDWLVGHDDLSPPGITRLLRGLYERRADLQKAFPDIGGADRLRYLNWVRETGVRELGLPGELVAEAELPRVAQATPARRPPQPLATEPQAMSPRGVNVVGYFETDLGMGEAARQIVCALDMAGLPAVPLLAPTVPPDLDRDSFGHYELGSAHYPINLICTNPEDLPELARLAGESFFDGRYSIGLWSWDVSSPPADGWDEQFALLDEIWAPSHHVARAVSAVSPVPVVRIPLPISMPRPAALPRVALELPQDRFVFLFSFDYRGGFERKNPLAVVEAFRTAFDSDSGAALLIKSINAHSDPANRARLREAVGDRPDVRLIEHHLSSAAKGALLAASDCYVSLHRAEGFGLTIAEAMCLGKPVIATGYSGNLDFMTPWNSYPVDWEPVPIGPDASPYPSSGEWAQPKADHAAALMRQVFERRSEALEHGRRAAADIARGHAPHVVGPQMMGRLDRARATAIERGRWGFPSVRAAASTIAHRVEAPLSDGRALAGPRNMLRRAALRMMRPFTSYQYSLDAEVLARLDSLEAGQLADRLRRDRAAAADRDVLQSQATELQHALDERSAALGGRLERLESEQRAIPFMEGKPFAARQDPVAGVVIGYTSMNGASDNGDYRAFEDVFRGSESRIRERQRRYLPVIGDRHPVLDFGCGRGELLDLLREAGISYVGVDTDSGMVARCREKGHRDVVHGDGLAYLRGIPDASLGVIFTAQVIEHLSYDQLHELLTLGRRKLKNGGLLIAETVNPHCPSALKTFWVDLTHQRPIFPEVALELCREAGFGSAYFFHPNGTGDVEHDRFVQGEFAVVATAGAASRGSRVTASARG
jgi:SAM-dependent methyltransferase/glycosyltransferase involved in cell wall biosynthesis